MPGLDPSIVEHSLPFDTEKFPPKRQQLRQQRASLLLRIKEEVVKQINAGFLEVCNYSEWVANIVPVEKKDGRVRVCVDYRDLNKASPKDNFHLPHIDVLVDNTARHAQFSFMDGFSGYNQIRMAEKDKLKTTFTTMWGTFCYRVMPFGHKNAEATYQRAMVTLFHDMMHKEVEHLFDRLKEYKLRLNPAKCTFGARSGKLLGFVVSERSIEVDPDKVKAIKELPPPSMVREVRGFLGLCAPEFNLVGARLRAPKQTRLGSVHLPGDARRTHVRRSRHLLFTTRRSRAVELPRVALDSPVLTP
ncbi:hypothetical protein CRG98_011167 [Punica granatum]|uniref:Reverse transcriptase domain-containing protein n=1 Tax=Punica granatum TaxID=22663 RepID=A0A2I0KIV0_PUNGR|nr:hypothetical protein CRG98_011167 [Punica granatum]